MKTDLSDLIDAPRESLDVEVKRWMDLSEKVNKAKIAKHLAALSNHGGGYLIFGICDDYSIDQNRPESLEGFNRDAINSIVESYLSPNFHCEVFVVKSRSGQEFPVVHVPSHGSEPVCARRNGPHDKKGNPEGIRAGDYYVRAAGPKSIPISSSEQWRPLIRRCALNEREALLRELAHVLDGRMDSAPTNTDRLASWDVAVAKRYGEEVAAASNSAWPVPLADAHYQLSYLITHDESPKSSSELLTILSDINTEVRDTVWTGWSMFYPFTRPEIAPAVFPEHSDGRGNDLLEANLVDNAKLDTSLPDFWRVSTDGRASIVRAYREDDRRFNDPGKCLSPLTVLRETAELVRHARAFARWFPTASTVSFRCTWLGLKGRSIQDLDHTIAWYSGKPAVADKRIVTGEWPIVQLNTHWPEIVANLGCPILALFGMDCSVNLVRQQSPRFKALRGA